MNIIEEGNFKYIETKGGPKNLVLLHGLFGALSNFEDLIEHFGSKYNVIVPILPIYELPILSVSLGGLVNHLQDFVRYKGLTDINLLGNSLGGHIGLLFALEELALLEKFDFNRKFWII
jgi:2-hydroxy-6-oxonona-2,4-dienedioate hydrolase